MQAIARAFGPVFISAFRSVPKPAENISRTTPISAHMLKKSLSFTIPSTLGPIKSPAIISPTTCGAFSLRAKSPNALAKITIIAISLNIDSTSN